MYNEITFLIENNIGLGILQGLDTSPISMLTLKKFATEMM